MRDDFTWFDAERLIRYGAGALDDVPRLLQQRGFSGYALLTTERAAAAAPALVDGAGVVLEVPPGAVPDCAAFVRGEVGERPVVGLGGGRVIDSAKAIAAADGLAVAAIPTTLSGAEMTRIHRLPAGVEGVGLVRPSLVIGDPALLGSQPMPGLAASAMNALAHASEALYTPYANPAADACALDAAALIARGLGADEPDRRALALAGILAGYAIGSAGLALLHVLSQTTVRETGAPHAKVYSALLPPVLAFMARRAPDALGRLAKALGAESEDPEQAAPLAAGLAQYTGVSRLSEIGVKADSFDEIVRAALGRPELRHTPEPPGNRELRELLERAY
ncbi:MAG TPA: iron-containing alcohol dehydrogenase [Thermoleophilaceae bacterium]